MRLLLDAHFSSRIAEQLRHRGHDVIAAIDDRELRRVSDEQLLERAAGERRALITNNARDLVPIAAEWARTGRDHHGLILSSDRSMPRTRAGIGPFVKALDALATEHPGDRLVNRILWLSPPTG